MNTLAAILLAASIAATPPSVPGDANGDGTVNQADIDCVLANWLNTEVVGPPEPTPLERLLADADIYTAAGWTVGGRNACYLRVWAESEDLQAMTGARYRGSNWTMVRPAEAMSGEEP